jgi:L-lactate dehydrogenase complex protein LldG
VVNSKFVSIYYSLLTAHHSPLTTHCSPLTTMRDITTSKEKLLKKIRKALLEKRDNPYPNLEDLPHYPLNEELPEVLFAEQFTAISGQFVFCEDEVQFIENLLELAEKRKWQNILLGA